MKGHGFDSRWGGEGGSEVLFPIFDLRALFHYFHRRLYFSTDDFFEPKNPEVSDIHYPYATISKLMRNK